MKGVSLSKAKKFSPGDLEMAYAFQSKFGRKSKKSAPSHQHLPRGGIGDHSQGNPNMQQKKQSPGHLHHQQPAVPHYRLDTSPQHALGQQMHQRDSYQQGQMGQGFANSMPHQGYYGELFGPPNMMNQSSRYSGQQQQQGMQFGGGPVGHLQQQDRDLQRMSMLLAANPGTEHHPPQPFHHSPPHQGVPGTTGSPEHVRQMRSSTMELYPLRSQRPTGDMLDASRASGMYIKGTTI